MAFPIDPRIEAFYDVTFVLGAMVFCADCRGDIEYASLHPRFMDENYYDAAVAMHAAGWVVVVEKLDAYCPACAAKRGLEKCEAIDPQV